MEKRLSVSIVLILATRLSRSLFFGSSWKHWGCVSSRVFSNMKNTVPTAEEIDGYEALKPEDQEKVKTAYSEGHVAEEDIPETAKKTGGDDEADEEEDEDKPAKKGRATKKKADADEEKPKRAPRASRKVGQINMDICEMLI